jgi:hypothetical protein
MACLPEWVAKETRRRVLGRVWRAAGDRPLDGGSGRLIQLGQGGTDAIGRPTGDGIAVAGADDLGLEFGQAMDGAPVLGGVEQEAAPAQLEAGPGNDGVADEEGFLLGPPEGQVAGAVAGGVDDGQRADLVTVVDEVVDLTRAVFADVEVVADLEGVALQGACGRQETGWAARWPAMMSASHSWP